MVTKRWYKNGGSVATAHIINKHLCDRALVGYFFTKLKMPPDYGSKKKGGSSHHSTNNAKEDKHAKVKEKQEEDPSPRLADELQEDIFNSETKEESNAVEEEITEPPKPPYDAMRSEPVLTKLIVESYEGDLDENGFYEGEGMVHFVGGHWYKGTLKHNNMDGQGVYSWADGTMYAGEFSDNKISGKGTDSLLQKILE